MYHADTGTGPEAQMPMPVLAPFNASTSNRPCPYWVMYRTHTGTGPKCKNANTGTTTIECQYL